MKQIEIVADNNYIDLQNAVNSFLKKKDDTIRIKDIKLSSLVYDYYCLYIVMIIYEVI